MSDGLDDLDLSAVQDPAARAIIGRLLGLIEQQAAAIAALKAENQRLRDEHARLKGEQGKPRVLPRRVKVDRSSEGERRAPPRAWHKGAKHPTLVVGREEVCRLDPATLPDGARLKDYPDHLVQELIVRVETVRFRRERWLLPSGRTVTAPLPAGYGGAFGPQLRASVLYWHYAANVSQPQIHRLLTSLGVRISRGYLAGLVRAQPAWQAEARAIGLAGLTGAAYAHLDVTPTRVGGAEQQCHVLGGAHWVSYHTLPWRDRQAAVQALQLGTPCRYQLTPVAWTLLDGHKLAQDTRAILAALGTAQVWEREEWRTLLDLRLPWLSDQHRARVSDAAAIGYYHAQSAVPVVPTLVVDDAPAFRTITAALALCWVHEGRHYKQLEPVVPAHRTALETFRAAFWTYYHQLAQYRLAPTPAEAARLDAAFDTLVATRTGYAALDARIAKTAAHKHTLLRVLDQPALPLHNNPAELGARRRVRKRDVSFGVRDGPGAAAWDAFHTVVGTAQLLGVNVLHYFHDRLSGAYRLPALADLVRQAGAAARPTSAVAA